MDKIIELIDRIADACYSDSRDIAKEEIGNLIDRLLSEDYINEDLIYLLNQINSALEANDYTTIADYLIYGLKAILMNKTVPESVFYSYSEIIPNVEEDIFYLQSFLEEELVLCLKNNDRVLRFNSLYSPTNEAEHLLKSIGLKSYTPVVCVFGLGTGILVEKILERLSGDSILIIYEPDKKILEYCKNAASTPDSSYEERKVADRINRIIADERVKLYVENDHTTSFQVILESYIDYLGIAGFIHIINSGYPEAYSSRCLYYYRELEDFRVRLLANKNTELHFMEEYIDYSFRNVQLCKNLTLASKLKKIIPENIPVIIVSAGPSLNKNIEELRKVKGHFFIIAVDTAVQTLLKRDIIPDLWVTIDPQKPLDFFKDERSYDIPCAFKSTANADILKKVKRVFLLDGERGYLELLIESLGVELASQYGSGGSVATTSFAFVYSLGMKNIILVGQDLAYFGDSSHADGVNDGADREVTFVEGIDGKQIKTRFDWLNYLKWFEHSVEMFNTNNLGISVIDATEGGAKIHGTKIMTLNEAIESYKNNDGKLPEFNFSNEVDKLPQLFDEQGYIKLREQHNKNINRIHEIESDASDASKICDKLIAQIREENASDIYIHKQNKKITQLRDKIEKSPIFYMINRYAQNFTQEKRVQLELKEDSIKNTRINLVEVLKLTFDSYVNAAKKIYETAKKYEKEI